MAAPTITTLPDAPTRDQTPGQFAEDADTFVAALPTFVSEANVLAQFCEDEATDAETAKTAAEAAQSAAEAAQAAAEGVASLVNYQGTWSAGSYDTGESVYYSGDGKYYISESDGNTAEPPAGDWTALDFLLASNDLSDIEDAAAARTNLGLAIGSDVQAYDADIPTQAATQNEMETGTETALRSMSPLRVAQAITALASAGSVAYGLFRKASPREPLFTKTGAGTGETDQQVYIEVNGLILSIASGTSITMPGSFTTGADYAIWCETDGTLTATTNFVTPPSANARQIGGFHYAPGSCSTGTSGGNSTPQINEYSFWDLKYRPACDDPRGMAVVAGGFYSDIYLLNTDPDTNGTSSYGKTIADGSSPPKIPAAFGGNGSTTYGSLTWFEAMEALAAYGKRAPTQQEFMALAYGVTEATARGSDPGTTGLDAARTSKWGIMQATGNLWVWGNEMGGPYAGASWSANTEGRGSTYNGPNAAQFGAYWLNGSNSGSRSSLWYYAPSDSLNNFSARGVCDLLILE